jgi:CBS domain-containing protein
MSVREHQDVTAASDELLVEDVMHSGVIVCPRELEVPSLADAMVANRAHAVVVSSRANGPPLVVSDLAVIRVLVEQGDHVQAGMLAREPAVLVDAGDSLTVAIESMAVRYVDRLLVADPVSGALVGVVSALDVAAVIGGGEPRAGSVAVDMPARGGRSLREATVVDVMRAGVLSCPPDAPLRAVARAMADHLVHCVAVAGVEPAPRGQRFLWGLIADIDLIVAVHGLGADAAAATIAARAPLAAAEDEPLDRVAALMVESHSSHVVAVGRGGLPSGIVSTLDVLSIVAASA